MPFSTTDLRPMWRPTAPPHAMIGCNRPKSGRAPQARSSPHPTRVHVEIGFLLLELGRVLARGDSTRERAHVARGIVVEDQHAAEHLEHDHQARVGILGLDLALPLAADREHLAVEPADRLVVVVVEHVVAAQIDEVAARAVNTAAVLEQEEREVLRQQRPLVGRALEVDHVLVVADVEGVARDRQAGRAERELQAAPDHQVHGGAPVDGLVEELEHEALVHAGVLAPEILAVAEQAGALALLDHLGEDIHVGGELARLGAVAAVLVDAELDRIEGA